MEMAHWILLNSSCNNIKNWPSLLHNLLECAAIIFQFDELCSLLSYKNISSIGSSIFCIIKVLKGEEIGLKNLKYKPEEMSEESHIATLNSCLLMASLISWMETNLEEMSDIPAHSYQCIRSIVVSVGRNQKVNWFCRTPVEAWQIPISIDCPPPLPMHLLHDADILRQIVLRIISLIGWTGRLQFEETWVCLLSALSPNPDIDATDQEEISVIMQANSIAVDGITWLVLSTLAPNAGNPNTSSLLHIPRHENTNLYKLSYWKKLEEMNESLCRRLTKISSDKSTQLIRIDKRPNIERGNDISGYSFGQLSVSYLQTQITPPEDRSSNDPDVTDMCAKSEKRLSSSGIDIRSCTQFLLDLFSQWTIPNSGISLNLQLSMVKSILSLSDMFTERSHYTWMLSTLLDMSKNHPQHDEVLHQYLVIGVCKAAGVLKHFEGEIAEKVIKVLEGSLKNQFSPMRSAGVHGLLYLLQSIRYIKRPEPNADNQKFGAHDFRQKIMQVTLEYTQKYCTADVEETSGDVLLGVALVIYLLEYFPDEVPNTQAIMKYLSQLIKNPKNNQCYQGVMQGLERVVLCGRTDLSDQITRIALDRFSQSDPCITLPGLQLLVACIYSGQCLNAIQSDSPDRSSWTMEIMEKTSALFDRIKKGYPIEVELVCEILPRILADFFPASDILTKVIGEFLSPNQPHKRNMAAMVFQVFTQACSEQQLPLLQDWVVHSLSNFTNNLPVAVWSLCCFFISASANPWLRAIFPHVQSRIRQCDYEDRKILCIAAVDFYRQLDDKQREIFLQSFKESSTNQKSLFADVIACL